MRSHKKKILLGASLGNCVHVAGILSFMRLAEEQGYETHFLGPATPINKLTEAIRKIDPDIIALSYRLTPEVLEKLLFFLKTEIQKAWMNKTFVFGGTPPAVEIARKSGLFEALFSGREPVEEVISFLKGKKSQAKPGKIPPQNLIDRIAFKAPYPLFRHHFGLPSLADTIKGARKIALSGAVDILSLGPDQNAQESFFRPSEMVREHDAAGGVPLRKPKDLEEIYQATRCGNFPLLRCYSGTRDLVQWAELSHQTINIAWGAVPLFWYNTLDGRSNRRPAESIKENQAAMKWYAEHSIPLEVNESHQWSLREAPDVVAVAAAFLAAYNAKKLGVSHYVAQYMFNTPSKTSPQMDIAKMLAKKDLIDSLEDKSFTTICQTRTGLASLSPDFDVAKGQLAASTFCQLTLKPQIVHVVAFCEADHAAFPSDIIESAKIAAGVIEKWHIGPFSLANDDRIRKKRENLVEEAQYLLQTIQSTAPNNIKDPWTDVDNLVRAVRMGLLDAPHLCGNPDAAGKVVTQMKDGACVTVDPSSGKILSEKERIMRLLN